MGGGIMSFYFETGEREGKRGRETTRSSPGILKLRSEKEKEELESRAQENLRTRFEITKYT